MLTRPAIILRGEGAALLIASVFLYKLTHGSWLLFATLFLAPDLSMLGYLGNPRVGADLYNFAHTLSVPFVMIGAGFLLGRWQIFPFALIWIAHIGLDRFLGYGLKYPTHFKDTHLQHV
jgi:hypothetical protein